jgi:signal transduction histidine kinase
MKNGRHEQDGRKRLDCRPQWKALRCLTIAVLLMNAATVGRAQATVSSAMRQKEPFSNPVMHGIMRRTLLHMDAFHADSAMHWIARGLAHIGDREAPEERYFLLTYRAEVLYYEGLFTEGMQDLDRSMAIAMTLNDSLLIANVYNLRGLLHENIQESRAALPYMRMALLWFPRDAQARYPVSELYHIHGNLGSYLMNAGRSDSAGHHLGISLRLASAAGAARATAVAWWSLGKLALVEQMPDSAQRCFERCIAEAVAHNEHDIRLDGYTALAQALVAQQRIGEARAVLERGSEHSAAFPNGIGLVTLRNFARERSKVLRAAGDDRGALAAIGEWHRMDSSITTSNTQAALRIQSELLRSDASLELARVERERIAEDLEQMRTSRALLAAVSLLVMLVVLGAYLTYRSRQRSNQRLSELEVLRLQQERTIAELRIREEVGRDMHDDLGAGLSTLKLRSEMALRSETDPRKREFFGSMAASAGELIGSMRQIIWAMNNDQGTLADTVPYINGYAGNYLAEHELEAELVAPGPWPHIELTSEQRRNLFLVVKECLHNIVKHAQADWVELRISHDRGVLHLSIADNGIGLPSVAGLPGGNGLRNVRLRMERLGGSVHVTSDGGTRIECNVPLAPTN